MGAAENSTLKVGLAWTFVADYNLLLAAVMAHTDLKKHWNESLRERFGPPILEIENLHPEMQSLQLITRECALNAVLCGAGAQDLIVANGVNAIVGDMVTETSENIGVVAGANGVPHLTLAVGSTLGGRVRYPYSFRSAMSVATAFAFFWEYMSVFDFRSAVLIYTNDGFGTELNVVKDAAQADGRASAVESIPLFGTPPWHEGILTGIQTKAKETRSRLLCIGPRLDAVDYFHAFLRDYNMTRPYYQVLTSAVSMSSTTFDTSFLGWHYVTAYFDWSDGLMSRWYQMRANMTQEDITGALSEYGIDGWAAPFYSSMLPSQEALQVSLTSTFEAYAVCLFDTLNLLYSTINSMLNEGYTTDQIRGAALMRKLQGMDVLGVGRRTTFDDNQDAIQVLQLAQFAAIVPYYVASVGATILVPVSSSVGESTLAGDFPGTWQPLIWPDGTTSLYPPKEYVQCHPGTSVAEDGTCQECIEGQMSTDFDAAECTRCPTGSYATTDRTQCLNCTVGYVATETGLSTCSACPAGQYAGGVGESACELCPRGSYSMTAGSSVCASCESPLSTVEVGSSSSASCVCPEGTYRNVDGSCESCGEGLSCEAGSDIANIPTSAGFVGDPNKPYPAVEVGYYTTYAEPLSVYECLEGSWCPGGYPEHCADHSGGISCGKCTFGNFRATTGECESCSDVMRTRYLLLFLPLLGLPVIIWACRHSDDVSRWYRAKYMFGPLAYITMFFIQSLSVYSFVAVTLPSSSKSMTNSFALFLDIRKLVRPECAEFHDYGANFYAGIAAPIYFVVLILLAYVISIAMRCCRKDLPTVRWPIAVSFYGACFSTLFLTIASSAFTLFACYPHPNGKHSLRASSDFLCFEPDWNALVGVGVGGILIYCVGSLVLMSYIIWRAPAYYGNPTFRTATKFLFVRFRTGYGFWSIVLLVKGLLVSLTTVMFTDAISQFMWLNFVLVSYVPFTGVLMPWRASPIALVDVAAHVVLSYSYGMGGFFVVASESEQNLVATWLIIDCIAVGIMICICAAQIAQRWYIQEMNAEQFEARQMAAAKDFHDTMLRILTDEKLMETLFKILPDWEIQTTKAVRDMLDREATNAGIDKSANLSSQILSKSSQNSADAHVVNTTMTTVVI